MITVIERYTTEYSVNIDLSTYNLTEIAKRIGCSRSYLSKVKSGKIKMSGKLYKKMVEELDLEDYLTIWR